MHSLQPQCHSYSVIFSFQEGHVDDKEEGGDDDDDAKESSSQIAGLVVIIGLITTAMLCAIFFVVYKKGQVHNETAPLSSLETRGH